VVGEAAAFKLLTFLADPMTVDDLRVVQWKRFGHNRLYVNAPGGERIGWVDLATDAVVLENPQHQFGFWKAIEEFQCSGTGTACGLGQSPQHRASAFGVEELLPMSVPELREVFTQKDRKESDLADRSEPRWNDLALNAPGDGIRKIALQKWDADPIGNLKDELCGIFTDERAFRIGADGEEAIGTELSALPADWHTIHSIPVGISEADIDHLAIGPAGVFSINTKHHPGANVWVHGPKVLVNGFRQDYVAKSQLESERVSKLLGKAFGGPIKATAIIAVVGARNRLRVKSQPTEGSVVALDQSELLNWLLRQDPIMLPDQVEWLFSRARRSTTWV
jgi:hypothetical protein